MSALDLLRIPRSRQLLPLPRRWQPPQRFWALAVTVAVLLCCATATAAWTVAGPTDGMSAAQYGSATLTGASISGGAGSTSLRVQFNVGSGRITALGSTAGVTISPALPAAIFTATGTLTNLLPALAALSYAAPGSGFGGSSDSLQLLLFTLSPTTAVAINTTRVAIALVNRPPTIAMTGNSPALLTVNEGSALLFDPTDLPYLSVADDSANNAIDFNLTVSGGSAWAAAGVSAGVIQLSTTTGLTFYGGTGDGQSFLWFRATVSDAQAAFTRMRYVATVPFSGTATLRVSVSDLGFGGSSAGVATNVAYTNATDYNITVVWVPTTPALLVPASSSASPLPLLQRGFETLVPLPFAVANANLGPFRTLYVPTLSIACSGSGGSGAAALVLTRTQDIVSTPTGTVLLPNATGMSVPFEGTLSAVNNALSGLVVRVLSSTYVGPCTLTIRAADAATPLASQPIATVEWQVLYTNAAPVVAVLQAGVALPTGVAVTMTRDQPLRFDGSGFTALTVSVTDSDAVSSAVVQATVSVALTPDASGGSVSPGVGSANLTVGASAASALVTVSGQGTAALSFSGTLTAVNGALAALVFTTPRYFYGVGAVTIRVDDGGATGAGPAQAGAAVVNVEVPFSRYPLTVGSGGRASSAAAPVSVSIDDTLSLAGYWSFASVDGAGVSLVVTALSVSAVSPASAASAFAGFATLKIPDAAATALGLAFDVGVVTASSLPFRAPSPAAANSALSQLTLALALTGNNSFPSDVSSVTCSVDLTATDGLSSAVSESVYLRVYPAGVLPGSSTGAGNGSLIDASTGTNGTAVIPPISGVSNSRSLAASDIIIPVAVMLFTFVGFVIAWRQFDPTERGVTSLTGTPGSGVLGGGAVKYLAPKFRQGRLHDLPATASTKLQRNFQYSHLWWSVLDAHADVETHDSSPRGVRLWVLYCGVLCSVFMTVAVMYGADPSFDGLRDRKFVREHLFALIAAIVSGLCGWLILALVRTERSGQPALRTTSISSAAAALDFAAMARQNEAAKSAKAHAPADAAQTIAIGLPAAAAATGTPVSPRKFASPAQVDPSAPRYGTTPSVAASPTASTRPFGAGPQYDTDNPSRGGAFGDQQRLLPVPPLALPQHSSPNSAVPATAIASTTIAPDAASATASATASVSASVPASADRDPDRVLIEEATIRSALPHPLLMSPLSEGDEPVATDATAPEAFSSQPQPQPQPHSLRPVTRGTLAAPATGGTAGSPSPRASPNAANVLSYRPLSEATRRLFDLPRPAPLPGARVTQLPPLTAKRTGALTPGAGTGTGTGTGVGAGSAAALAAAVTSAEHQRALQVSAELAAAGPGSGSAFTPLAGSRPLPGTLLDPASASASAAGHGGGDQLRMHLPTHSASNSTNIPTRSVAAVELSTLAARERKPNGTTTAAGVALESPTAARVRQGFGATPKPAPITAPAAPVAVRPAPSPVSRSDSPSPTPGGSGRDLHGVKPLTMPCTRQGFVFALLAVWGVTCAAVTLAMAVRFSTRALPDALSWAVSARWAYSVILALLMDCLIWEPLLVLALMASGCGLRVTHE